MENNNELEKRVYVRTLKEILNLEQLSGDDESLNRWIIVPDLNRPGLELTGYHAENDLKRVNIIGNKEVEYLNTLDSETIKQRINLITDVYTPCIIISSRISYPKEIIEVASKKNFPVFMYYGKTYELIVKVVSLLSEKMAPSTQVHGVMMSIYGKGVLITGQSGIGKSELALDLIKRGHMLVADDRVDIINLHQELRAKAPDVLKGMLEIRGLGVVDVALLFGAEVNLDASNVDLVINLVKFDGFNFDRLNLEEKKIEILGINKPTVDIPVSEGRQLASIIEAAVTNHVLLSKGINTTDTFKENVIRQIEKNKVGNL